VSAVAAYLAREWDRLLIAPGGKPDRITSLFKTPRFRASAHVLHFVFGGSSSEPLAVVKAARLADDCESLDREAENLRRVQAAREGGFDAVPRVLAYERFRSVPLLVETVVRGDVMSPALVRRRTEACLAAGCEWLAELHRATSTGAAGPMTWEELTGPLERFADTFADVAAERDLVARTMELLAPLRSRSVVPVFEHGDFSAPNLLLDDGGRIGVVDWELAEPRGLPCADLFFFLTYVAFAGRGAKTSGDCVRAFHGAFFGASAWGARRAGEFASRVWLPEQALRPLLLLSLARYVARTVERLGGERALAGGSAQELHGWIRRNRFHALWEHAIDHWRELALPEEGES
jgi:aminoglycoside phosphotransferase (APT) family kinase protein